MGIGVGSDGDVVVLGVVVVVGRRSWLISCWYCVVGGIGADGDVTGGVDVCWLLMVRGDSRGGDVMFDGVLTWFLSMISEVLKWSMKSWEYLVVGGKISVVLTWLVALTVVIIFLSSSIDR